MTIDNYYNYITLMTFEQLYKFEGKTSISVDTLNELRNALLEEVIVNYKNDDHRYPQEIDRWQGEVSFSPINEQDALKEFLEEYKELINNIKDDYISGFICPDNDEEYREAISIYEGRRGK